jgi:integrase
MVRTNAAGEEFPPTGYVFGDETGHKVGSIKRAWQTTVLRSAGHKPVWNWKKKLGPNDKGTTKLDPQSQVAYRAVNLHFHDLRHEGASRLLEAGWPLHHIQHMLGHASIHQTSTYLNATLRGLHESMREMEEARAACKPLAKEPALAHRPDGKQTPVHDGNSLIH